MDSKTDETGKTMTPEQKARRKLARKVAMAFWKAEFKKTNPKADQAAIKAAWGTERRARTKTALIALRQLEKSGVRIDDAAEMPAAS
ncbi:hypothetical protein M8756_03030 [Lutimaribacter sp. EGI FJ00015]|uniref:Uncharacterized protein n=1 Tax=Lutimaribacter degradans TaxID=2945989 RepID=A0ACC5ZR36_9RHOB|nr:hypothetical protein [Lutimaribacter sp. EGI FJ00013]MCM2560783.1 hypothetical protein [Lutimaribacter sp. EGI FJ00013]MCO0612271.1 hypothetical protein [Lutimaribacter sp. EGI FJ00015]MCO0634608.1 hypothetical protein [Lutimaribacter sp. EGI FJ00014]